MPIMRDAVITYVPYYIWYSSNMLSHQVCMDEYLNRKNMESSSKSWMNATYRIASTFSVVHLGDYW